MNFLQLTTFLTSNVLQRPGDATYQGQPAANPPVIGLSGQAILEAHLEIQRSARHDWTAQEGHQIMPYNVNGILLPDTCKRARAVWTVGVDGASGQQVRGAYIQPSTTDANEADAMGAGHGFTGRDACATGGFGGRGNGAGGFESVLEGAHWWVEERKLMLSGCTQSLLWVDQYTFLDPYVLATDTDWFSVWAWDYLVYKAAELGSLTLWRDDRMSMFRDVAAQKMQDATDMDAKFGAGGQAEIARAPVPNFRVRR